MDEQEELCPECEEMDLFTGKGTGKRVPKSMCCHNFLEIPPDCSHEWCPTSKAGLTHWCRKCREYR